MATVTRRHDSTQYDGTNGSYIAGEWLSHMQLVSDDGQTLEMADNDGRPYTVQRGQWLVRGLPQRAHLGTYTEDEYHAEWTEIPEVIS